MHRRKPAPILASCSTGLLLVLGSACSPLNERPGTFIEGNNNERLPVSFLGGGGDFTRVTVPVEVVPGVADFMDDLTSPPLRFSEATVAVDDSSGFGRMYVELSNTGGRPLCFVESERIEFLDAGGGVLATESGFIEGSLAIARSGTLISSCLAEGGEGILLVLLDGLDAAAVSSIRIGMLATLAWEEDAPDADVVPVAATVDGEDASADLEITLENRGTVPATLENPKVAFFDEGGGFLDWHFAQDVMPETIAPGETAVASLPIRAVSAEVAEVVVHLDWDE